MAGQRRKRTRDRKRRAEKIIHVVFGPGGGRVRGEPSATSVAPDGGAARTTSSREPVTDLFTRAEVSRLLGVSSTRLSSLDRNGVVSPSGRRRGRRAYTFTDL